MIFRDNCEIVAPEEAERYWQILTQAAENLDQWLTNCFEDTTKE
jgi:hypothetical protein